MKKCLREALGGFCFGKLNLLRNTVFNSYRKASSQKPSCNNHLIVRHKITGSSRRVVDSKHMRDRPRRRTHDCFIECSANHNASGNENRFVIRVHIILKGVFKVVRKQEGEERSATKHESLLKNSFKVLAHFIYLFLKIIYLNFGIFNLGICFF